MNWDEFERVYGMTRPPDRKREAEENHDTSHRQIAVSSRCPSLDEYDNLPVEFTRLN